MSVHQPVLEVSTALDSEGQSIGIDLPHALCSLSSFLAAFPALSASASGMGLGFCVGHHVQSASASVTQVNVIAGASAV